MGEQHIPSDLSSACLLNIKQYNDKNRRNRYILNEIKNSLRFCGAFELPLWGHDKISNSENPGVIQGHKMYNSDLETVLKCHIKNSDLKM